MEKSRKGMKPVKLPAPLFVSWQAIVSEYVHQHVNEELIPVVVSLQKLISAEDASYDKQAACIKESVKLMQKNVAYAARLQPHEILQIKFIVEPVASLGYFAACENLSRRTFIPLIEAAYKCTSGTDVKLKDYYMQYTSNVHSEPSFEGKPLSQKALAIYATLKFPLGHDLIVDTYRHTLQFLVKGLQHAQHELTHNKNNSNADQLMNDIQFTVKTLLVLLSRQLEVAPRMFEKVESKTIDHTKDQDVILLGDITQTLLDICMDTTTLIKECNQTAGMAIAAVMNLANDVEFARDWVLGWFFTTDSNAIVDHIADSLGVPRPRDALVGSEGWRSRDAPMVFALRGLVSSLRKDIVMLECPKDTTLVPYIADCPAKNLHEIIFYSINLFCARADIDSACKVIAFESMATWLQQTKEIMEKCTENDTQLMDAVSGPIQPKNINMLIQYVWDHWDDPIDSIQHKVRTIFELSIATLEIKTRFYQQQDQYQQCVHALLKNLLAMDWHRKVKYSLLNMLVEKVHTDAFLQAEPRLMEKCLFAMDSLILCPQITFFILAFLYRRVQDTIPGCEKFKGHNGKIQDTQDTAAQQAVRQWIELWVLPLLQCLTAPSELLRKNASGFLLQPLFKISAQSFWYMIRILEDLENPLWKDGQLDPARRLNAFIAVLKSGRGLDIVDGTAYTQQANTQQNQISVDTLKLAIYHSDAQVRMDVLGLLCESRKATAQVTSTELDMLQLFIPLNMNSTAPEFRQQMCAHLSKILLRLRGNLYSQYRNYKSLLAYADKCTEDSKRENALLDAQEILVAIDQAKTFLYWLCDHVAESLYPGASYQRVATALRILSITIKIFGVTELPPIEGFTDQQPDFPFTMPIANPRLAKILVDVFMNPYDFNRVQAFEILCQFPSPLPGIEAKSDVQDLLWWGLNNVVSTRAGESDSGAMVFRLIFTKYVMGLGFDLSPEQNAATVASTSKASSLSDAPIVFTERLLDLLEKQVNVAKSNLLLASQQHPMHGTLLALQYVFQEIDYKSATIKNSFAQWTKTHARAIELIHMTCHTVMPVLSDASPEGNVPTDYREDEDEEEEDEEVDNGDESGPKHQVILSCCWRAVKEASSLLQVIIAKAPASAEASHDTILTHQDLVKSGQLFHHLLTSIRHRGAFSAVYPAYVALNTRLLTSRDPFIAQLPAEWLQENLDSLTSSNISITRRSAGLPLCILAIVSSEPSVKKELLSKAITYLMQLAGQEPPIDADQRIDLPQVHAYNIMRTIFMDSKLGTHVLEYASEGFSLAINGFSSHSWAIRNCSVMLFSTLLQRTFGTKKTRDEHSNVNTLTGREFFVRFPALHPYLLKELGVAVDQLLQNALAASVHPGLYPILTLLSRMQPSNTAEDATDGETVLTPFIPLVMPCAASAIYKTREMAARALVPLVLDVVPTIKQLLCISNTTTQNEIHGRLLQVQFLLRGHFYSANYAHEASVQFIREMPSMVMVWLDLLREKRFCNMNSALLLTIVSEFFFDTKWIVQQTSGSDKNASKELMELADEYFAGLRSHAKDYCVSTINSDEISGIGAYLMREGMATIIVNSTLDGNTSNVKVDDLLFLLQDHDYEVRLLVLQKLLNYYSVHTVDKNQSGISQLQSILVQRTFAGEDSLNCYVLTAKLLMALNSKEPYPTSSSSKLPFTLEAYWNQLVVHFSEKRALSVTESVLPLLGALLAQILRQTSPSNWVQQCLVTWSGYIEKYSQKDITLPLREAVVKSLGFTSTQVFMSEFDPSVEDARVTAALAITQLLQDDDVDVRDDTATIVSHALRLKAPVHHERALELVHRHLITRFKNSDLLETTLSASLVGQHALKTVWENELSQSKALFAKENPNIYKEDLIDLQWANVDLDVIHLARECAVKNLDSFKKRCQQLNEFSHLLRQMSRTLMQQGPYGITSRSNIFLAAYSTIESLHLDLETLDKTGVVSEDLIQSIQDVSESLYELKESWVHPVLWNLLRGDDGLYVKTKHFIKYHARTVVYNSMFLLAPDSRKL
ncbi:hypothetical protein MUCCIDRAFT_79865 [Mucor lusitanicus CBS 277.49]|uniref:Uncharacterized protein n=2 Tax=Mucor circinelloides f. lusitanicus TaxID=29924 RepID=A0A162RFB4_MUCCL|nr:hypothetical protein MUCCIDRAFT_79865 [Mucor lusitanicus CBS 277.49]